MGTIFLCSKQYNMNHDSTKKGQLTSPLKKNIMKNNYFIRLI